MNLPDFPITDILQNRSHSGHTGRLCVVKDRRKGEIYLVSGMVTDARFGPVSGEAAIHMILNWGHGLCQWFENELSPVNTIYKSVEQILIDHSFLEGMSEGDLIARFNEQTPPAAERPRRLSVIVQGVQFESFRFDIDLATVIVGREPELCNVVVPDDTVSSQHGMFTCAGHTVRYKDLGSTNGSWINGQMVSEVEIVPGMAMHMGTVAMVIHDLDLDQTGVTSLSEQTVPLDQYISLPDRLLLPMTDGVRPVPSANRKRLTSKVTVPEQLRS
jgi:hypothetical protein